MATAMVAAPEVHLGMRGRFTPTGLLLPDDMPVEEWLEVCEYLGLCQKAVLWWWGDALAFGERKYGEMYSQALDATDYSYQALNDAVYVAKNVTFSRRRENLSWSHHREVAPLPPAEQEEWLLRAEEEGLTRAALRAAIKQKAYERKLLEAAAGRSTPEGCGEVACCDALVGLRRLEDGQVHLIFADPPYNLGVAYGEHCDDARPPEDYFAWCAEWLGECYRVLADGGSAYFMHYPEVCSRWLPFLEEFGFTLRRWLTWVYPCNVGQSPRNWTRAQRAVLFCTKGEGYTFNGMADPQPFRNPDDGRIEQLGAGGQSGVVPYDWWEYDLVKNVSAEKTEWPNQLPTALLSRVVKTSSLEGDTVLDPFMGSGTTAEAAQAAGRRWIGFDSNPRSAIVTAQRLAAQ